MSKVPLIYLMLALNVPSIIFAALPCAETIQDTAIFQAIKENDSEKVTQLLESQINPDCLDQCGLTPLMVAASIGQETICNVLLGHRASVSKTNAEGKDALILAAEKGHVPVCETLLNAGADLKAVDKAGRSALHVASMNGHTLVCHLLIDRGADINHGERSGSWTPLMLAAWHGQLEVCELLVHHKVKIDALLFIPSHPSSSALDLAAQNGHGLIALLLLKNKATNRLRLTELMCVAMAGDVRTCEHLVKQDRVDDATSEGITALMYAAQNDKKDVCDILLKYSANQNKQDTQGKIALQHAAESGCIDSCKILLLCSPTDHQDKNYMTALMHAAQNGHTEVCQLLILAGADINIAILPSKTEVLKSLIASKRKGLKVPLIEKTALSLAADNCHGKVCHLLLMYNPQKTRGITKLMCFAMAGDMKACSDEKLLKKELKAVDKNGMTALMYALKKGYKKILELFIEHGADVNGSFPDGTTIFMHIVEQGYQNIAASIVHRISEVLAQDGCGKTLLMYVAQKGYLEVLRILIDRGAKVDACDNRLNRALHYGVRHEQLEVCSYLIEKRAEVNGSLPTVGNKTPLGEALSLANRPLCYLLVEHGATTGSEGESYPWSAYTGAALNGFTEVCALIQRRRNSHERINPKALKQAIERGDSLACQRLIEWGVSLTVRLNSESLLRIAEKSGNYHICDILLKGLIVAPLLEHRSLHSMKEKIIALCISLKRKAVPKEVIVLILSYVDELVPLRALSKRAPSQNQDIPTLQSVTQPAHLTLLERELNTVPTYKKHTVGTESLKTRIAEILFGNKISPLEPT